MQARPIRRGPSSSSLSADPQGGRQAPLTLEDSPMRTHSRTTSTKAGSFRQVEVITGIGRRRRWTDEEKAWIVAESL
ncbi:MAG: hypothetical protein K0R41_2738 [Geminicoccaceae bacterium]|nr:hypothetical protein [Geminicoccaceae bacterium]